MNEEWKPVIGYEGLYEVSNMGRIKSLERTIWTGRGYYQTLPERIMKLRKSNRGYLYVFLHKEGKIKYCTIHKLVAQAFCENPEGYNEVNHINENKEDNRADNLEYCSRAYNNNYGTRNKRAAEKLRGKKQSEESIKKRSKPVFSIDKESGLIMYWESITEAERCTGIANSGICACLKGKRKSAGNHIWFYAE